MRSKEEIEHNKQLYLDAQSIFLTLPKGRIRNMFFWMNMYPIASEFFTNLIKKKLKLKKLSNDQIYEYMLDCCILLLDRYNKIENWQMNDLSAMGYWIWVGACQNKKIAFEEKILNIGELSYDSLDTIE